MSFNQIAITGILIIGLIPISAVHAELKGEAGAYVSPTDKSAGPTVRVAYESESRRGTIGATVSVDTTRNRAQVEGGSRLIIAAPEVGVPLVFGDPQAFRMNAHRTEVNILGFIPAGIELLHTKNNGTLSLSGLGGRIYDSKNNVTFDEWGLKLFTRHQIDQILDIGAATKVGCIGSIYDKTKETLEGKQWDVTPGLTLGLDANLRLKLGQHAYVGAEGSVSTISVKAVHNTGEPERSFHEIDTKAGIFAGLAL